jgi:DNA invertase Pin-like site-specific DNA recombinase
VTKAYNRNGAFDYKVASLVLAANDNFPIMDIADIFDLPRPTIGNIFRAYKVKAVDARRLVNQGRKLTEEDVLAIFSMRKENHSLQKIADRFDISRQLVNNILQGKVYVDVSEKYTLI